ncbi:hypothetical protein ADK38_38535, partial [Streptomyces varsoviensis]
SAAGTLRGHYSARTPVPNLTWTRDQYLGGSDKDLAGHFKALVRGGLVEDALAEKGQAARMWREIVALSDGLPVRDRDDRAYVRVSARYGLCLYSVIHHGWQVMLRGFAGERGRVMAQHLRAYDAAWEEWRWLARRQADCASLYQPLGFGKKGADGVYGADPEHGMGPSVEGYRRLLAR